MPDVAETVQTTTPTARARNNFVVALLLFFGSLIVYLVILGDPQNTLHSSALAWSFTGLFATFGGYIFSVKWDMTLIPKQ